MTAIHSIYGRAGEPRTQPSPLPMGASGGPRRDALDHCSRALDFARRQFGISDWRPLQAEAIAAAFARRDSLVVMGTGSGKSLCYQVPALMISGLTVVVSPLIALMKDQVDRLQALAFPVAMLNHAVHHRAESEILRAAMTGRLRMLYVSPERCTRPDFLDVLTRGKDHLAAFVIDEAHCISQWGHDFRKAYASLGQLRVLFPKVPIHAFTATATPRVRAQIVQSLGFRVADEQSRPGEPRTSVRAALPSDQSRESLPLTRSVKGEGAVPLPSSLRGSLPSCLSPIVLIGEFDRPNLFLRVHCGDLIATELIDEVRELRAKHGHGLPYAPSGIVYCITRAETERISLALRDVGLPAVAYHAGMDNAVRVAVQEGFAGGDIGIVVATIAFGMGIDKSDVRYVIHWGMPSSPDVYHQEIGRAGRDGNPADCVMFHSDQDYFAWRDLFESVEQGGGPPVTDGKMDALADMESYCGCSQLDVARPDCRHAWLRHYFSEPLPLPRGDTEGSIEPRDEQSRACQQAVLFSDQSRESLPLTRSVKGEGAVSLGASVPPSLRGSLPSCPVASLPSSLAVPCSACDVCVEDV